MCNATETPSRRQRRVRQTSSLNGLIVLQDKIMPYEEVRSTNTSETFSIINDKSEIDNSIISIENNNSDDEFRSIARELRRSRRSILLNLVKQPLMSS